MCVCKFRKPARIKREQKIKLSVRHPELDSGSSRAWSESMKSTCNGCLAVEPLDYLEPKRSPSNKP